LRNSSETFEFSMVSLNMAICHEEMQISLVWNSSFKIKCSFHNSTLTIDTCVLNKKKPAKPVQNVVKMLKAEVQMAEKKTEK
jgi:hypothetical protein